MTMDLPSSVDLIDRHIDEFFDDSEVTILHEKESTLIHLDIYIIWAGEGRPFHTLLTCGMSALPMRVPEDVDEPDRGEVMMLLPPEWELTRESFADERNYWPVRTLKILGRLPHEDKTWLGYGHTLELSDDPAPRGGFNSVLLLDSLEVAEEFTTIEDGDETIRIHSAIPLYPEELALVRSGERKTLLERFEAHDVGEIVAPGRVNVGL